MACFLAGDLGGTKTILTVCTLTASGFTQARTRRFASAVYPDFCEIVAEFLGEGDEAPSLAAFGVAGPLVGDRARMTNLGWDIDRETLKDRFHLREVLLLNDLVAMAKAVPALSMDDLVLINPGHRDPQGSIAVLAPGTGLGQAYLCWDGSGYRPHPSEGGHVDFAPTGEREQRLLAFLAAEHGHVSYEQLCSGMGIPNIYRYLTGVEGMAASRDLIEELATVEDPTPVLIRYAIGQKCPVAGLSLDIFLSILAAEAGNLALKFLATGGVYLGGGILPRLLPILDRVAFMKKFLDKGRMADILAAIPVSIISTEEAGLIGVAMAAREAMVQGREA